MSANSQAGTPEDNTTAVLLDLSLSPSARLFVDGVVVAVNGVPLLPAGSEPLVQTDGATASHGLLVPLPPAQSAWTVTVTYLRGPFVDDTGVDASTAFILHVRTNVNGYL